MSQTCDRCGTVVYRRILDVGSKKFVGVDCGCRRREAIPRTTKNCFDLTLDHVHDEFGQKLHVENIRQLSAAETRLGFQSVVLNSDAQNFDDPPQQRRIEMRDVHNWKFSQRRGR